MSDCEKTAMNQDYDALREKNIAERNAFLEKFQQEITEDMDEINKLENQRIKEKENKVPKIKSSEKKSNLAPRMQTRSSNKKCDKSSSDDSDEEWQPNNYHLYKNF